MGGVRRSRLDGRGAVSIPSPLGRYDRGDDDDALFDVLLQRLPVKLLAAGREYHDELMREFALLALSGPGGRSNLPTRLVELTEILGVQYGAAAARPDQLVDDALARGDATIDLSYRVPAHVVDVADRLGQLMDEADEFCRAEQLLTMERTPVQISFAEWYLQEFRRQVAGEPPRPWDGPLEP